MTQRFSQIVNQSVAQSFSQSVAELELWGLESRSRDFSRLNLCVLGFGLFLDLVLDTTESRSRS